MTQPEFQAAIDFLKQKIIQTNRADKDIEYNDNIAQPMESAVMNEQTQTKESSEKNIELTTSVQDVVQIQTEGVIDPLLKNDNENEIIVVDEQDSKSREENDQSLVSQFSEHCSKKILSNVGVHENQDKDEQCIKPDYDEEGEKIVHLNIRKDKEDSEAINKNTVNYTSSKCINFITQNFLENIDLYLNQKLPPFIYKTVSINKTIQIFQKLIGENKIQLEPKVKVQKTFSAKGSNITEELKAKYDAINYG